MGEATAAGRAPRPNTEKRIRPDHFSTYVPREVVRRLKVVATIRDMPLWAVVTDALEDHLDAFQKQYGRLPALDDESTPGRGH